MKTNYYSMALGKGLSSLIPQKAGRSNIHKETTGSGNTEKLWHIPLSEIVPNSEQPRKHFSEEALEDLVSSIKKHGILQPLTVTEKDDGGYELIAGERRLRAAQAAGLATVPCLVRTATEQEKLELAIIENVQRQDLNPIEEAFAFKRLIDTFGLTQQQVADQVGKSRPVIGNTVRLLELPEDIQKALVDGVISAGKARALLGIKDAREQQQIFNEMSGKGITVREVEKVVSQKSGNGKKGSTRKDPTLRAQEQMIEDRLGASATISKKGERGTITISFHSNEEFKRIMRELT